MTRREWFWYPNISAQLVPNWFRHVRYMFIRRRLVENGFVIQICRPNQYQVVSKWIWACPQFGTWSLTRWEWVWNKSLVLWNRLLIEPSRTVQIWTCSALYREITDQVPNRFRDLPWPIKPLLDLLQSMDQVPTVQVYCPNSFRHVRNRFPGRRHVESGFMTDQVPNLFGNSTTYKTSSRSVPTSI